MDSVDHDIIDQLSRDGRLTNAELADRVGLTPSPCLRRVRRLEEDGIIAGYHARIDPKALGRGCEVIVNVEMEQKTLEIAQRFEEVLAGSPEVIQASRMFGLPDYVLTISVADIEAAERFITRVIAAQAGVAKVDSHLAMSVIKAL